jgi:hypothetical protein
MVSMGPHTRVYTHEVIKRPGVWWSLEWDGTPEKNIIKPHRTCEKKEEFFNIF